MGFKVKTIRSNPEKHHHIWRYIGILAVALLAIHALGKRSEKKKQLQAIEQWEED